MPLRFTAFYLLFPSSSCRLIRFPPPTGLSRSFRPTRSSALSGGSPLVALLGFSPSLRLDPVGHSGPLGLLFFFFPICTCSCLFTPLTEGRSARDLTQAATSQKKKATRSTACFLSLSPASVQLGLSRSFRPTRSLATSSLFLASALPLFMFHLSLNPVGHSGPLGSWQPLFLFSHSPCLLCHHFPTSSPPLGPSGSFRPTRSLATSSLFLASAFLPLSPKPEPSRSFRPTRFLATSHLLSSSTFPGLLVITATTQSVIPAHSVTGFTSEHCAGQRYGNAALVMCRCDKFGLLGTGNIACLFLPSRLWALCSPLSTLKFLTWCPDIFPRTH